MKLTVHTDQSWITRFHHTGSSTISGFRLGRSGSFGDFINLASGFGIGAGTSSGNLPLNTQNPDQVDFFIHNATNQIGIGTTSPKARLDVHGDIKLSGGSQNFKIANLSGAEPGYGEFVNYGGISINGNDGNNRQMFMFSDGVGTSSIFTVASSIDAGSTWSSRFTVQQNGNVGIGTTSTGPHKLAVEGSVGAREIKVQAPGTGWSDFVFEEDYNLRSLKEVENFISENNHLPDIPSQAEVTESGINLGEMDAKLLQKIEELTLYLIEQNKKIETLTKENLKQAERLKALETKL